MGVAARIMQGNHLSNDWIARLTTKFGHESADRTVSAGLGVTLEPSRLDFWCEPGTVGLEERFGQVQTPVFWGQSRPECALDPAQPGVQRIASKFSHEGLHDLFGGIEQARGDDRPEAIVRFVEPGREHPQVLELVTQLPVTDLFALASGDLEFNLAWTKKNLTDSHQPTSSLGFLVGFQINVPIHEHHPFNVQNFATEPIAGDDPERKLLEDFLVNATTMVLNLKRHDAGVYEPIRPHGQAEAKIQETLKP